MKTEIDHLPTAKQRELAHVVRILFEEFGEITARTTDPKRKAARILKLVLFGSYARGDWVDDPVGGYHSDYDILMVVNDERLTDVVEYWAAADDRLMREVTIAQTLTAPVNFIVHTLADVNKQLERGRPFFVDILKQGIALYEAEGFPFVAPQNCPRTRRGRRRSKTSTIGMPKRKVPRWVHSFILNRARSVMPHFCSTKQPNDSIIACCWCCRSTARSHTS